MLIADVAVGLELSSICCATPSVTQARRWGLDQSELVLRVTELGSLRVVMLWSIMRFYLVWATWVTTDFTFNR